MVVCSATVETPAPGHGHGVHEAAQDTAIENNWKAKNVPTWPRTPQGPSHYRKRPFPPQQRAPGRSASVILAVQPAPALPRWQAARRSPASVNGLRPRRPSQHVRRRTRPAVICCPDAVRSNGIGTTTLVGWRGGSQRCRGSPARSNLSPRIAGGMATPPGVAVTCQERVVSTGLICTRRTSGGNSGTASARRPPSPAVRWKFLCRNARRIYNAPGCSQTSITSTQDMGTGRPGRRTPSGSGRES